MTELEKIELLEKQEREKDLSNDINVMKRVHFHSQMINASPERFHRVRFQMVSEFLAKGK